AKGKDIDRNVARGSSGLDRVHDVAVAVVVTPERNAAPFDRVEVVALVDPTDAARHQEEGLASAFVADGIDQRVDRGGLIAHLLPVRAVPVRTGLNLQLQLVAAPV